MGLCQTVWLLLNATTSASCLFKILFLRNSWSSFFTYCFPDSCHVRSMEIGEVALDFSETSVNINLMSIRNIS